MNIQAVLLQHPHDPAWVKAYVRFVDEHDTPEAALTDQHHILPRSVFPEFASFEDHPWNRVDLTPANHLIAHYYLFKALPWDPSITLAFKMMVGFRFKELRRAGFPEALVHEVAEAFEAARGIGKPWNAKARQRRSESMKGRPVHTNLSFGGKQHREGTKVKMSTTHIQNYVSDPNHPQFTNKPTGPDHWTYGQPRDPRTRSKISASLTGKTASDLTRARMSVTHGQQMFDSIPSEERKVYTEAAHVPREEDVLELRKAFKINSRPYTILTGIRILRLGKQGTSPERAYQQADTFLRLANLEVTPLIPRSADSRLGTGHRLLPGQIPAHQLRNVGLTKGVTRAKQAFEAITPAEAASFEAAWGAGTTEALLAEQKKWEVRGRAYNILFGLRWIHEGKATKDTFERWRQAGIWLRLSGKDVPVEGEALEELLRVVPLT